MEIEDIKKQLEEFKKELPIDSLDLSGECLRQPDLYQRIGTLVMNLKNEARVKKNHYEFVVAKTKQDIRNNPGKYSVSKLTGDSVSEACCTDSTVVEALQDYSEAQHIADSGMILKEAVEQRKSLIRDSVTLYVHEYYMGESMNSERKEVSEVTEEQIKNHRKQFAASKVKEMDIQEGINEEG